MVTVARLADRLQLIAVAGPFPEIGGKSFQQTSSSDQQLLSRRFSTSVHLNDVVRLPCLVEQRFRRAVEAHISEPTSARNGLDPVLFLSFWSLRAEVDVHRTIGVGDRAGVLADAR